MGKKHDAVVPMSSSLPLVWGFGLEPRDGKWLACRISTNGDREYIGPKQHGEPRPESKAAALGRLLAAQRQAYAPSSIVRFA